MNLDVNPRPTPESKPDINPDEFYRIVGRLFMWNNTPIHREHMVEQPHHNVDWSQFAYENHENVIQENIIQGNN